MYYYAAKATNNAGSSDLSTPVSARSIASSNAYLSNIVLYSVILQNNWLALAPFSLTLTPADSSATITSVSELNDNYPPTTTTDVPNGTTYELALIGYHNAVTIVVTAGDGTTTQTYTIDIRADWNG